VSSSHRARVAVMERLPPLELPTADDVKGQGRTTSRLRT
jgi:hypothetical protein